MIDLDVRKRFSNAFDAAFNGFNNPGSSAPSLGGGGGGGSGGRGVTSRVNVWVSNRQPLQGETVAIRVTVPQPRNPWELVHNFFRCKYGGGMVHMSIREEEEVGFAKVKVIPVFMDGSDRWCGYVSTTPLDTPGSRTLVVDVHDGQRCPPRTMELRVRKRPFNLQHIWLDEDKRDLLEGCGSEEAQRVHGALSIASPVRLWRGDFRRPCGGPVTTEYGVPRSYNGKFREGYFHAGVDYGAPEGAPVIAPADGRVVLVGEEGDGFPYHGTCVSIDHGHGVVSLMMHLGATAVTHGDSVVAGQLIGKVGATGIATGPHLHWGLHVGGDAVDPTPWLKDPEEDADPPR